jgi:hypothetical protein
VSVRCPATLASAGVSAETSPQEFLKLAAQFVGIKLEPAVVFGQIKYGRTSTVHAKRPRRRTVGMAVSHHDPQPAEAPQPPDRQHRLTPGGSLFRPPHWPTFRPGQVPIKLIPHIPTASRLSGGCPFELTNVLFTDHRLGRRLSRGQPTFRFSEAACGSRSACGYRRRQAPHGRQSLAAVRSSAAWARCRASAARWPASWARASIASARVSSCSARRRSA